MRKAPQIAKPLKPKRAKETQIPHWPCQKCKTGTLRFIGIVTVDEVMNKAERTS
ncbi:hypothetical protein PTD2_22037 [Pseudoalteromonas tunicata D2]|uniref:Uncharacterized protein n=1 Tax=Pseudoalteromonas tunicata D2 TaxID=87626 RepID=A4CAY3_9GAMM|nr:hypothetical protein PTD2_22037 [Pseudoalteromonas tunicata D2]